MILEHFLKRSLRKTYLRELSMALDLIAMAMESGLDFNLALDRVVRYGPQGALTQELRQTLKQIALGKRRLDTLRDLQKRTGLKELGGLIQAFSLSDSLGGNLASTLQTRAQTLRQERLRRAEQQAQKVPVKLVFPLVFLIFPCIFLILFGPIVFYLLQSGIL